MGGMAVVAPINYANFQILAFRASLGLTYDDDDLLQVTQQIDSAVHKTDTQAKVGKYSVDFFCK